jgi:hypothetical protein
MIYIFTKNLNAELCDLYEKDLLPSAKKWFGNDTSKWVLQEDNDPKHTSKLDLLKNELRHHQPKNLRALKWRKALISKSLPYDHATNFIEGMKARGEAIIKAREDYTVY